MMASEIIVILKNGFKMLCDLKAAQPIDEDLNELCQDINSLEDNIHENMTLIKIHSYKQLINGSIGELKELVNGSRDDEQFGKTIRSETIMDENAYDDSDTREPPSSISIKGDDEFPIIILFKIVFILANIDYGEASEEKLTDKLYDLQDELNLCSIEFYLRYPIGKIVLITLKRLTKHASRYVSVLAAKCITIIVNDKEIRTKMNEFNLIEICVDMLNIKYEKIIGCALKCLTLFKDNKDQYKVLIGFNILDKVNCIIIGNNNSLRIRYYATKLISNFAYNYTKNLVGRDVMSIKKFVLSICKDTDENVETASLILLRVSETDESYKILLNRSILRLIFKNLQYQDNDVKRFSLQTLERLTDCPADYLNIILQDRIELFRILECLLFEGPYNTRGDAVMVISGILNKGSAFHIQQVMSTNILKKLTHKYERLLIMHDDLVYVIFNIVHFGAGHQLIYSLRNYKFMEILNLIMRHNNNKTTLHLAAQSIQTLIYKQQILLPKLVLQMERVKVDCEDVLGRKKVTKALRSTSYYDYTVDTSFINRKLPDDILEMVFRLFSRRYDIRSLLELRNINKRWYNVINKVLGEAKGISLYGQTDNLMTKPEIDERNAGLIMRNYCSADKIQLRNFRTNNVVLNNILKEKRNLKYLSLSNIEGLTIEGYVKMIVNCESLKTLILFSDKLNEQELAIICTGLQKLEVLILKTSEKSISGESFRSLGLNFKSLFIDFPSNVNLNKTLEALARGGGKNMIDLGMVVRSINRINWDIVSRNLNITKFYLIFKSFGRVNLSALGMWNLTHLRLIEDCDANSNSVLCDEVLIPLVKSLPNLIHLGIRGIKPHVNKITGNLIRQLTLSNRSIEDLDLLYANKLTSPSIKLISLMSGLKKLKFQRMPLTSDSVIFLIKHLSCLNSLTLFGCTELENRLIYDAMTDKGKRLKYGRILLEITRDGNFEIPKNHTDILSVIERPEGYMSSFAF